MRIAFVTPELGSLVRRTNLAGVAQSLATALQSSGQEVRAFVPWTRDVDSDELGDLTEACEVRVRDGVGSVGFRLYLGHLGPLPVVLFDNAAIFGNRHPYGDEEGPYPDLSLIHI